MTPDVNIGHEVQFHAWDHRRWQDELPRHSSAWIRTWFARGVERGIKIIADRLEVGGMHVLPVHAEVEGSIRQGCFVRLMEKAMEMGYSVVPLHIINETLSRETLPVRKYQMSMLPGRAAPCAV